MTRSPAASFRFFFTAVACLLLLPLKWLHGREGELHAPLLSSWVADTCFLFWLCLLSAWVERHRTVRGRIGGMLIFGLVEIPILFTITSHSYYLEEATARQFSLLEASLSSTLFFIQKVVETRVLLTGGALLLAVALVAWGVARKWPDPSLKKQWIANGAVSVLVLVHMGTCTFYPSVLWEVGRDIKEAYSRPAVTPKVRDAIFADAGLGRTPDWSTASHYDRVVVLVMESVPLRELELAMAKLPANHFFSRYASTTHAYTSYFSTNQDSRTGLLAMLFSRIIPFEAYAPRDAARYLFLQHEPSMLDNLAKQGFRNAIAAAQTDQEIVVFDLPTWKDKLTLSQAEFDHPGGFLCFNPYDFEHDCEDKILLPKMFDTLARHPKVFLMQEGIYGHIGDYEDATGKSPVQYYGEHLQAIVDHLDSRREMDRTLIVVTSDHGLRTWNYRTKRWVYRLPLLFINPRLTAKTNPGLYNQSDFQSILAAEMTGRPAPMPRQVSPFVSSTFSSVVGSVTDTGDLLVVKNRKWRQYVLADGHCDGDETPTGQAKRQIPSGALITAVEEMKNAFYPASR